MPNHVVTRLAALLNDERKAVRGSKVLLLGLAYKRDTNDIRESPSLKIVELLTALGADILAVDDLIDDSRWPAGVTRVALTDETLADVDAALVVTAHSDQPYHLLVDNDVPTLDTQRVLRGPKVSVL